VKWFERRVTSVPACEAPGGIKPGSGRRNRRWRRDRRCRCWWGDGACGEPRVPPGLASSSAVRS